MKTDDFEKAQGHWILARMGKKVLRPGGRELTEKLIEALEVAETDSMVEFAPGLGFTATKVLAKHPRSYTGIDASEGAVKRLRMKFNGNKRITFIHGQAADTKLPAESQDKVYGEAMLTMHADHRKLEIIREAHRILKPGGYYAIHELGLVPDNLGPNKKAMIQRDLAMAIKVNARPLTEPEWTGLLKQEGFTIKSVHHSGMYLLHAGRMIRDEGFFRTLKIAFNIFSNPPALRRVLKMWKTFKKHEKYMNAIAILAVRD
jgi:SAM-dependent methyltransferase